MKSILDKKFRYRPSFNTDVTKSWAEARKKLEEEKQKREEARKQLPQKLTALRRAL